MVFTTPIGLPPKTAGLLLAGALALLPFRLSAAVTQTRTRFPDSIRAIAAPGTGSPHRPRLVRAQLQAAELAADQRFEVVLRLRNFDELQGRIARGELIAPAEMAARYFPLAADYARTVDWLADQGLSVTRTDPNRVAIFGHGSVDAVRQALQVDFARIAVDSAEYTSAVTAPTLPADLAPAVLGIHGLQPHVKPHRLGSPRPALSSGGTEYLPSQVAQAYGAGNLSYNGTGQTIAIFGGAYPSRSDLTQFGQRAGTPGDLASRVQFVPVGIGPEASPDSGLLDEVTLDAEWTAGMATGATVRVYGFNENNPAAFDEAYLQVYADLPSQPGMHQLSISFGYGEKEVARDYVLITAQYTAMLASAGVSIFASSGDTGQVIDNITQVSVPASDPSVTGVGGTSLASIGTGFTETAWSGSGGGPSAVFAQPAWQTGTGVPTQLGMREVPDVAAAADPNNGALIIRNGADVQYGGTSWSAPVWAAFCAIINQARAANAAAPLGLLNPKLYPLMGTAAIRDITMGPGNALMAPGFDRFTGIGVPNVAMLIQLLGNAGAAPLIVVQSGTRTVTVGQGTVFSIAAQGLAPLTYQWQRQPRNSTTWTDLPETASYVGTTTPNLYLYDATFAMNGDSFQCVVTNASGTAPAVTAGTLLVNPYGVTTLAGWPQQAGSSDGRGRTARFFYPGGMCIDASGALYVSDGGNSTIRKILPNGTVTTVAGSPVETGSTDGAASVARFNGVGGVAVDSTGNLYVADSGNCTIRKITPAGVVSTLAGLAGSSATTDGTGAAARFADPQNLTVDPAGNVYVADGAGGTIRKVTPAGVVTTVAGLPGNSGLTNGPVATARFDMPIDVALDTAGNIYVADYGNSCIRKITPDGTVSTFAGSTLTGNVDGKGTAARFDSPAGLAVDSSGNVYVADAKQDTIRRITPDGTVTTVAGLPTTTENIDGDFTHATFAGPADLAVDAAGVIYVADAGNNTIRRIVTGTFVVPTFTLRSPADQTVAGGQDVSFTIAATGSDPLMYQWYASPPSNLTLHDDATYEGTNTPTLTIHSASVVLDGLQYFCVVSNNAGGATSDKATLTVHGPPVVVQAPKPYYPGAGSSLTIQAATVYTPSSQGLAQYQWFLNGVPVGSVSPSDSIRLSNIQAGDTGTYSVQVTNAYGATTADVATVTLSDARVVNLSVRSTAGIDDQTLIVGFVITGSGDKTLLLRAVGPGIATLVPGALNDPKLRLVTSSGAELESSNDWDSSLAPVFTRLGASPFAANSKDAAIYRAIPAGAYSFHAYPNDNVSGIAVAELYDADDSAGTATVVNISARTQVGTGNNILIAGFVITGSTPKTILIRGVGPSLTRLGVSNALADPQLQLYKQSTSIASNDNWGGSTEMYTAFETVGATGFDSAYSKDAALLVTLQSGVYSAQVSGVGGTTGIGLVEIFLMP